MSKNNGKEVDYQNWETIFNQRFKQFGIEQNNQVDYSQNVLGKLKSHEVTSGATLVQITGSPGSGKTGVILSCIDQTLDSFPDEKVFFSECFDTPLQCTKLGKDRYNLMAESEDIMFFDRNKGGKQIYPEVTLFDSFEDCFNKAVFGKVNVLFFKDRMKIIDFIGYLRRTCVWNSVYIDEMSEVSPAFTSGKMWKRIEKFSHILKDVRKTCINVYFNTQSVSDVDHRILSKVMCRIFLVGAVADKHSRITQKAIDRLKEDKVNGNEGYVEYYSRFCKTRFNRIYQPLLNNLIEARKPDEDDEDDEE